MASIRSLVSFAGSQIRRNHTKGAVRALLSVSKNSSNRTTITNSNAQLSIPLRFFSSSVTIPNTNALRLSKFVAPARSATTTSTLFSVNSNNINIHIRLFGSQSNYHYAAAAAATKPTTTTTTTTINASPSPVHSQLQNALKLAREKKFDEAEAEFGRIIEMNFNDRTMVVQNDAHIEEVHQALVEFNTLFEASTAAESTTDSAAAPNKSMHSSIATQPYKVYWLAATVHLDAGRTKQAHHYINKALRECTDPEHGIMLEVLQATAYIAENKRQQALPTLEKVVDMVNENKIAVTSDNVMYISTAFHELGMHYRNAKAFITSTINKNKEEALKCFEMAFSLRESAGGWELPLTTESAYYLAQSYFEQDQINKGIVIGEKAAVAMQLLGYSMKEMETLGAYLARAYEKKHMFADEERVIMSTLRYINKFAEEEGYALSRFRLMTVLATALLFKGDISEAMEQFNMLQNQLIPALDEKEKQIFDYAYMKYWYGVALSRTERFDEAETALNEAKAAFKRAVDIPANSKSEWHNMCVMSLTDNVERRKEHEKLQRELAESGLTQEEFMKRMQQTLSQKGGEEDGTTEEADSKMSWWKRMIKNF